MTLDRVLTAARLEDGGALVDIAITNGRVADIVATRSQGWDAPCDDRAGGLVFPGFVDLHTHLDKGHIWPRAENPDGTFAGAIEAVGADRRANWTAGDVARRFAFGLRCAYAHGTVAVRTHIDSLAPQHRISWPVFAAMRAAWHGRIALQGVAIVGLALLDDAAYTADLAACIAEHGGIMGGVISPMDNLAARIDGLLRLAADHGLALDVHIDETLDQGARSLPVLARAAIAHRFAHPIVVGHCCSLTVQADDEIARTLDLMAEAHMRVVSLPMCNMYLQDRSPGRTPRRRGVTLLHEFAARGIPVAVASDNCRDPFYAYGDHDMLEVFREAVRIAQLDRPFGTWHHAVTRTPADIMGLADMGRIVVGGPADLVLFRARSFNELLSRPQSDRVVLRHGVAIDTTLPDYAELDEATAFPDTRARRDAICAIDRPEPSRIAQAQGGREPAGEPMRLKLFACTHVPPPLVCSSEIFETLASNVPAPSDGAFASDLDGINIAGDNLYGELRHQYYVWKNLLGDYDYVGFEHYRRRFFIDPLAPSHVAAAFPDSMAMRHFFTVHNSAGLYRSLDEFAQYLAMRRSFDAAAIEAVKRHLGHFDIVVPRANIENIEEQWRNSVGDMASWGVMIDGIANSTYFAGRENHILGPPCRCYFANMYLMRTDLLDEYLGFCFDVLDHCRATLRLTGRALGYFSERVLSYWLYQKRVEQPLLKVLEMPLVMHGGAAARPGPLTEPSVLS